MTRTGFRVAYSALAALVGIPFLLSLVVNATPPSLKHLWPYFAGALALMTVSAVYLEVREHRVGEAGADAGMVADRLADSIYEQWRAEADAHRVDIPAELPVSWRIDEKPPFDTGQGPRGTSTLVGLFADIPAQRLIVLGPPGSGKTVQLIKLVLQLREHQNRRLAWAERSHADKVVPVLLSLSAWNPEGSFRYWLADRLIAEHPSLRAPEHAGENAPTLAQALVRENLILPVLDGFDEIPSEMRVGALEKISMALAASMNGPMGIIISSRSPEFRRAAKNARAQINVAPGAIAVVLEDVPSDAAMEYLDRAGSGRWDRVFRELGTETSVGKVLRTPLMLSLAHAVYNWLPAGQEDLPLPSPDHLLTYRSPLALRDHLFDAFVPAAYRDRPDKATSAARTLRYLAAYLEHGERDPPRRVPAESAVREDLPKDKSERIGFAWWRLRAAVPVPVIGLVVGLPAAVAVGLVAAVQPHLGVGLGLGMITGIVVGAVLGMISSRSWRLPTAPDGVGAGIAFGFIGGVVGAAPTGILLHLTGHTSSPIPGLMGALGAGIGPGVSCGRRRGIPAAAAGGVVAALTAGSGTGLPAGVVDGVGAWLTVALVLSVAGLPKPSQGIRRMRWSKSGYLVGAVAGLAIGTGVAFSAGPFDGLIAGTVTALAGGFAAGLEGVPADFTRPEAAASPVGLLARDRETCWLVAISGGTAFGVGAGLAVHLAVGLAGALTVGLTAAALQASWLPFVVARWWFAATGRLPLTLMSFLLDAYKRDVLRQAGRVYQFRNIELQRHLAAQYAVNSRAQPRNTPAPAAAQTRR